MNKSIAHQLEMILQFLLRLYGPLVVFSLVSTAAIGLFTGNISARFIGWAIAVAVQVLNYYVTDLLVSHRGAGRLITTVSGSAAPNDTLHEWELWLSIAVGAGTLAGFAWRFATPWFVPFFIFLIGNGIVITLLALDQAVFATFEREIFDPLLSTRKKAKAERRQRWEEERKRREEERRQIEAEQKKRRDEEEAARRNKLKPLDARINERNESVDAVIKEIQSLKVDGDLKRQLIESVENQFRDWLVETTNEDSFGA